jgi:hypothetical protein
MLLSVRTACTQSDAVRMYIHSIDQINSCNNHSTTAIDADTEATTTSTTTSDFDEMISCLPLFDRVD